MQGMSQGRIAKVDSANGTLAVGNSLEAIEKRIP